MTGPRGLVIAAPRSGAGKTTVMIGLLRALRRRGLAVRAAKAGPDYIDPGFHRAASGSSGVNLDSWAMSPELLDSLLRAHLAGADLLLIESAMGLFDGITAAPGRSGAVADLARRYGLPVLLVLDVAGQSQTAAAVAQGIATYDPALRVGGVVLNRVASDRHEALLRPAFDLIGLPVLGALRRDPRLALPERHLGLVQAEELAALETVIDGLADGAERAFDLDRVLASAAPVEPPCHDAIEALPPPGQRVAAAQDAAFTFFYPHLMRQWRAAGAELVPFSPLADQGPDPSCDACWLPGGYPELHAGRLAAASRFAANLAAFAATRPVHGECGGYMVLGRALEAADGVTHRMAGLLGHVTSFARRGMTLGYRQARLFADCPIGRAGETIRGHEFHYSDIVEPGNDPPLAALFDGQGKSLGAGGARRGHVTGTFLHAIARDACAGSSSSGSGPAIPNI
jgi:cobyrinic acid a,c-diamide synthase